VASEHQALSKEEKQLPPQDQQRLFAAMHAEEAEAQAAWEAAEHSAERQAAWEAAAHPLEAQAGWERGPEEL